MKSEEDSQPATATATAVAKTEEETSILWISFVPQWGRECTLLSVNHIHQEYSLHEDLMKLITTDLNSKVKSATKFRTNQTGEDLDVLMMSFKSFGYDMGYIKEDDLKAGCQDDVIGYVVHEKKTRDEHHYYALLQVKKEIWNMDSLTLKWPVLIDFDFIVSLANTDNFTVFIVRKKPMAIDWLPKEANSVLRMLGLQSKDEKKVVFQWNRNYLNKLNGPSEIKKVKVKMNTPEDGEQVQYEIDQPETNTLQEFTEIEQSETNTLQELMEVLGLGFDYAVTLKDATEPVPKHFWGNIPVKMVFDYSQGMIEIKQIETMEQGATKKRKGSKK